MTLPCPENSGQGNMPPAPSFVKLPQRNDKTSGGSPMPQEHTTPEPKKFTTQTEGISLPFLSDLNLNRDTTLILGLLLILYSEKADRLLLMALLYILL